MCLPLLTLTTTFWSAVIHPRPPTNSVYWLSYYLCERTEHIVARGVPQGLLLGPTLFTLYPLRRVISTIIPLLCHQHTALPKDWSHSKHSALSHSANLTTCFGEIKWMRPVFRQLNSHHFKNAKLSPTLSTPHPGSCKKVSLGLGFLKAGL